MANESRHYEEVAAAIKRALEPRPEVRITAHARVRDAVTGRFRDFDVLLETEVAGSELRIGVECRKKKRRVDKPQVEAFVTKLRDCGVNKGIFVSSSGFTPEAVAAATHYGIGCCHLTQVARLPWLEMLALRGTCLTNVQFHGDVELKTMGVLAGTPSMIIFPGTLAPEIPFSALGMHILSLENYEVGHHRRRLLFEPQVRPLAVVAGREPVPIVRVEIEAEFDVIEIAPRVEHWLYAPEGEAPSAGITSIHLGEVNGLPVVLEFTATSNRAKRRRDGKRRGHAF